ncbi:MAG TPA: hypothetical protein VM491_23790, partial [Burkholderiaceae bacterium]|nr:hypothetical protein [Burkholderiaceae bacterium]
RSNERLAGYVLGRDGRESSQLGPLLADDGGAARALLAAATERVPGPLYVDLADARSELVPQLQRAGFTVQRPFMRMALGRTAAPGDPKRTVLVAGPELG